MLRMRSHYQGKTNLLLRPILRGRNSHGPQPHTPLSFASVIVVVMRLQSTIPPPRPTSSSPSSSAEMAAMYPNMYRAAGGAPPAGSSSSSGGGGGGAKMEGGGNETLGSSSPFEYNTVLRQVFTAPAHKVAITVEEPGGFSSTLGGPSSTLSGGVATSTFTYGDLQKDILDLALRVIRPISAAHNDSTSGFDSSNKKACISPFHPNIPLSSTGDHAIDTANIIDDGKDNVAILTHPGYEFVVSLLASWVMNKMAVPMCHTHPYEGELSYVLENSKARLILADTILKTTKLPEAFSDPHQRDEGSTFDVSVTADVTEALLAMRELREAQNKTTLDATIMEESDNAGRSRNRAMPTTAEEMIRAADEDREAKAERQLEHMKEESLKEFRKQMLPMKEEKEQADALQRHLEYIATIPGSHDLAQLVNIDKVTNKDSDCLMIYTSGTTAKPKGVVHTHRSISNQVEVLHSAWKWSSSDVILNVLPLHHVHGLVNVTLCALTAQAHVIFTPLDNAARIARRLEKGDVTLFMGVPTIYSKLEKVIRSEFTPIESKSWKENVSASIRLMCCGSAALPKPTLDSWREVSGHTLLERYGMTEIGMALSQPLSPEYMRIPGTVGKPLSTVRAFCSEQAPTPAEVEHAAMSSSNSSDDKPPTQKEGSAASVTGSLMVNSPSLFNRYWNNPAATQKEVFVHPKTKEVFFNTGDSVLVQPPSGEIPSVLFSILGRSSVDIIKRSGYKLSAIEIESELLLLGDSVLEAVVLGVAHPTMGEEVCAVVVPTMDAITKYGLIKDEDLPEEEIPQLVITDEFKDNLSSRLKARLAHYKCPSHYILLQHPVPRNAMGKVNKKALLKVLNLLA